MKFALLHVDQAVELLLKERVRAGGKSIYKNPKETLTVWGVYQLLDEMRCIIPEKPDLELLHEERNNIQHKSSNPSAEDAGFYIEKALRFIDRFLRDELQVELREYLPEDYIDQLLG